MLKAVIQLILIEHIVITIVGITVSAFIASQGALNVQVLILPLVSFCLLVFGFNSLNGVFDLQIDKINKPLRPLPQKRILPRTALDVEPRYS
ncbi:MAG: UbiA family prenyltransferase [Candidatus Aenigmarchaeota archaeon]|nr:UbiA family prenyltransferase [Candidatus Aenigmarchaeota archaeon]